MKVRKALAMIALAVFAGSILSAAPQAASAATVKTGVDDLDDFKMIFTKNMVPFLPFFPSTPWKLPENPNAGVTGDNGRTVRWSGVALHPTVGSPAALSILNIELVKKDKKWKPVGVEFACWTKAKVCQDVPVVWFNEGGRDLIFDPELKKWEERDRDTGETFSVFGPVTFYIAPIPLPASAPLLVLSLLGLATLARRRNS